MPPCRLLDAAHALHERARERAALVAEELRLDDLARDRAAVQRHERPRAPRRVVVERVRDELLARPGLADEEDGRLRRGDDAELLEEALHGLADPEDRLEAEALVEALPQIADLARLPGALERRLGAQAQVVLRERLGDVVHGAEGARREERLDVPVRRHEEDGDVRARGREIGRELEPRPAGHLQVRHDERDRWVLDRALERRVRVREFLHAAAVRLERERHGLAAGRVVVHDEDEGLGALTRSPSSARSRSSSVHTATPRAFALSSLLPGFFAGDDRRRLLRHAAAHLSARGLDRRRGFVARPPGQGPREDEDTAGQGSARPRGPGFLRHTDSGLPEFLEEAPIRRVGEPLEDSAGGLRPDLRDRRQGVLVRREERVHREEAPGEDLGRLLADLAEAEAEEEAREARVLRSVDLGNHVRGRLLPPALERGELRGREVVEGRDVPQEARLAELLDPLLAEPLDVHRAPRHEVAERLGDLRRAPRIHATHRDLALALDDGLAAGRAARRHRERLRVLRPLLEEDARDLRDDVARLLDGDGVADAHVLAREVLHVVERRAADGRAREEDRRELRDRRQDARSAPPARRCPSRPSSPPPAGTCRRRPSAGAFAVWPRRRWSARESTFTTTPSVSNGSSWRFVFHASMKARTPVHIGDDRAMGIHGKRDFFECAQRLRSASAARPCPSHRAME